MTKAYFSKKRCCLSLLIFFSSGIYAQEPETNAFLLFGSTYVNNIQKVPVNKKSDVDNYIGLNVDKAFLGKNSTTSLNGFAKYHHYLKNTFSNQVTAQLSFDQEIHNNSKRFFWMTSDSLNSVSINPNSAVTPTNTQLKNTFSTGPDYHFKLDDRSQFILSTRYIKNNFQKVGDNNHRLSVKGTLNRLISTKLQAGLYLSASKDTFKSGRSSKNKSAGINFNRRILNGDISGDIGLSNVNTQSLTFPSKDSRSVTWNVGLNQKLTQRLSYSGHLYRQLENTSSQFPIPANNLYLQYNQIGTVKITGADLTLTDQISSRSNLQLGIMANKSNYLSSNTQNKFMVYHGRFDYKLTRVTSSVNKLELVNSRFDQSNTTDKLYRVSSGLRYQGIKGVSLGMTGNYEQKKSTSVLSAYKTWSIMLSLKYRLK